MESLIKKIKYQLKEGKHRVADWAVLELLRYIEELEKEIEYQKLQFAAREEYHMQDKNFEKK